MEPKFELRSYSDRKVLAEYSRKIGVPIWLPMTIITVAVSLYKAGVAAMWLTIDPTALSKVLPQLLLLIVANVVIIFFPYWGTMSTMHQLKAQNGGVEPETVATVGDTIEISSGITRHSIEFQQIIKVRRLKHSYVLLITKRSGVILRPDCFTKGTFEEFKQYLRQKRPDLVIPD